MRASAPGPVPVSLRMRSTRPGFGANVRPAASAGRLIISAVLRRDYPVVQGVILVTATAYVLINLAVDALYVVIDPRIRYE